MERAVIYFTIVWGVGMFLAGLLYKEYWFTVAGLFLSVGVGIIFRKKL